MNKMKQKLKMLKNVLRDALVKDKLENIMLNISMLSDKITNLESKILSIERDNEDLKVALGNLSIAYLELIKSFPLPQDFMTVKTTSEDENIEKLLKAFNSEQNDDDLIN